MMHIRRVLTLAVTLAALTSVPALVAQQNDEQQDRREQERRSQQEQRDTQALVQMVDAVAAGTQPAPADFGLRWEGHHFMRSADGLTYVPFTLAVDTAQLAAPGTALYVRAVSKDATPATDPASEQPATVDYPWDDIHFVDVRPDGKLPRAMMLEPGEYEVFVAIKEQSPLEAQDNQPPAKAGLLRRDLTVPDFNGPDLTISTPIIATSIEPLATPLPLEEQGANPYTIGGVLRVVPSLDAKFNNADELLMMFWIYGTQYVDGKPDVEIEYNFHQKTAEGEKFFNKAQPQVLNASTLPPTFDKDAGHQVTGFLGVPLKTFPAGDYRIEVTIRDNLSGETLTHNENFTVEA